MSLLVRFWCTFPRRHGWKSLWSLSKKQHVLLAGSTQYLFSSLERRVPKVSRWTIDYFHSLISLGFTFLEDSVCHKFLKKNNTTTFKLQKGSSWTAGCSFYPFYFQLFQLYSAKKYNWNKTTLQKGSTAICGEKPYDWIWRSRDRI